MDPDTLNTLENQVWPGLESFYGLQPPGILYALAYWETRGQFNDATSPKGAKGIFQLTPIALRQVNIDAGFMADPHDPYQASYAAAVLYARYLNRFKNIVLAIAAYNAGESRIATFVKQCMANGKGFLPQETIDYIAGVQQALNEAG